MIELLIITAAVLFIYLHFMGWLKNHFELEKRLETQYQSNARLDNVVIDEANKLHKVSLQLEELRTEVNALSLKSGMRLK